MKGLLPSSQGNVCGMACGRGTILWEHSNLCERTLGSAGRSNQASCAKPCQLTLHEEFLNDPKIQIEFLLGWVRHIHMRAGLGETSPDGEFSQTWMCRGETFIPPLPEGEGGIKESWDCPMTNPNLNYSHGMECHDTPGWQTHDCDLPKKNCVGEWFP